LVYEQLGMGGVATVHRAETVGVEGFRKAVALKRLLPHLMKTKPIVKAFVREAQLASHMQHENIAQTYELGKVGETYFIAMEFVPGPTLDQIMRHSQAVAGAIPIPVALGILIQVCDALDYAHNLQDELGNPLGIVHRDVSPPNIIVSNTGIVKLLDFGIAKVQNRADAHTTGQNVIKGKFNYLAPEYLGGQLDRRADLFAIGIIAHELLTGRRLFDGTNDFETSALVLNMPIQPPSRWASRVPRDLDDIILTALQRDPDLRWQSASALRTALANTVRQTNAVASHAEILAWVQWAFSQKPRPEDGSIANLIDTLEHASTPQPRPHRDLDEFSDPIPTLPGVGEESELMKSSERARLVRSNIYGSGAHPRGSRPMIIDAKPIQMKRASGGRSVAAGSVAPTGVPAPLEDRSGIVLVAPKPPRRKGGFRFFLYLLLVVIAAGGGVLVASYLLDLDLPLP
jgi:serine/threonine-protein kinase